MMCRKVKFLQQMWEVFEGLRKVCLSRKKQLLEGREREMHQRIRKGKHQGKETSSIEDKRNERDQTKANGWKRFCWSFQSKEEKEERVEEQTRKEKQAKQRERKQKGFLWRKSLKSANGRWLCVSWPLYDNHHAFLHHRLRILHQRFLKVRISGTKMVIKRKTPDIARQFLIIEGKPIYAIWIRTTYGDGQKTKCWDCKNPTDITSKHVCKASILWPFLFAKLFIFRLFSNLFKTFHLEWICTSPYSCCSCTSPYSCCFCTSPYSRVDMKPLAKPKNLMFTDTTVKPPNINNSMAILE